MDTKPSSSKSTLTRDMKDDHNVISKLRRLKIEENLLLQSIQKLGNKLDYEVDEIKLNNDLDCKNTIKKIKDSFINIKNLFEEVKTETSSQELLAELDIDEIKKKVFEFETTLKSFKQYLSNELSSLRMTEQEILNQIDMTNIKELKINRKRSKIPTTIYNQAVPSPVRLLMTSPFKCTEVQEFQDFMRNSPNRYGGWNEYHHNIFVKYWQKYFGNSTNTYFNDPDVAVLTCENFIEEALLKLHGINKENLMAHIAWYKKYIYLKDKQQKAIDKWKSNRMRNISGQVRTRNAMQERDDSTVPTDISGNNIHLIGHNDFNQIACNFKDISGEARNRDVTFMSARNPKSQYLAKKNILLLKEKRTSPKKLGTDDIQRHMKPTKQWMNRNYECEELNQQYNFIENMEKLRVPSWRKYLA